MLRSKRPVHRVHVVQFVRELRGMQLELLLVEFAVLRQVNKWEFLFVRLHVRQWGLSR